MSLLEQSFFASFKLFVFFFLFILFGADFERKEIMNNPSLFLSLSFFFFYKLRDEKRGESSWISTNNLFWGNHEEK